MKYLKIKPDGYEEQMDELSQEDLDFAGMTDYPVYKFEKGDYYVLQDGTDNIPNWEKVDVRKSQRGVRVR